MNESAADVDSPSSDSESCPKLSKPPTRYSSIQPNPYNSRPLSVKKSDKSILFPNQITFQNQITKAKLNFIYRSIE